jgi:hypothetical protein
MSEENVYVEPGVMSASDTPDGQGAKKAGGCGVVAFVLGAALIGYGVYLMGKWGQLGGGTRAGSVVLIVVGTLLTLPLLLIIALRIVIKVVVGRAIRDVTEAAAEMAKAGNDIVDGGRAMYGQPHEYRDATDADFANVYEENLRRHEGAGYRHVADLVNDTIARMKNRATPVRVMASPDGSYTVSIFDLKIPGGPADGIKTCDVTSEFTDGTFLMTSNTLETNPMTPPPGLQQRQFPRDTSGSELVEAHKIELAKLLAAKGPDVKAVTIATREDVIASERRQQDMKNAFRQKIGWIDPEEVRRIVQKSTGDEEVSDAIADATDRARLEQ